MWRVFSLTFVLYSIKIVFCGFGSFIFLCEMLFLFKDLTCYREKASKEKEISFSIVLLYRSAHFIWKNCFIFYCAISGEQVTSDSSVLFCFVLSQKKIKSDFPPYVRSMNDCRQDTMNYYWKEVFLWKPKFTREIWTIKFFIMITCFITNCFWKKKTNFNRFHSLSFFNYRC